MRQVTLRSCYASWIRSCRLDFERTSYPPPPGCWGGGEPHKHKYLLVLHINPMSLEYLKIQRRSCKRRDGNVNVASS